MLNLRTDIPIKADVIDQINLRHAQIRDLLIEEEQLMALANDNKVLLTREEVARKLRCTVDKIPRPIPRIRIGKNYLFETGDVEAYIQSKKKR